MSDIALDVNTHDVILPNGDLTLLTGLDAIAFSGDTVAGGVD